jgi:hypothetical protein
MAEFEILNCETCQHRESCAEAYGEKRDDGDDHTAMIRTHLCRATWDIFKCCKCK